MLKSLMNYITGHHDPQFRTVREQMSFCHCIFQNFFIIRPELNMDIIFPEVTCQPVFDLPFIFFKNRPRNLGSEHFKAPFHPHYKLPHTGSQPKLLPRENDPEILPFQLPPVFCLCLFQNQQRIAPERMHLNYCFSGFHMVFHACSSSGLQIDCPCRIAYKFFIKNHLCAVRKIDQIHTFPSSCRPDLIGIVFQQSICRDQFWDSPLQKKLPDPSIIPRSRKLDRILPWERRPIVSGLEHIRESGLFLHMACNAVR